MVVLLGVLSVGPSVGSAATTRVPGAPPAYDPARYADFSTAVPVYSGSAWRLASVDAARGRYRLFRVSLRTGRTTSTPITLQGAPAGSTLFRVRFALGPGRVYLQQRWCFPVGVDQCDERNQSAYLQQAFDVRDGHRAAWAGGDDLVLNGRVGMYSGAYLSDELRPMAYERPTYRLYDVETRQPLPFEIPTGTLWLAAGDHVLLYRREGQSQARFVTLIDAATGKVRYAVDLQKAARAAGGTLSSDQPRVMPDGSLALRIYRNSGSHSLRPTTIDPNGKIVTFGRALRRVDDLTTIVGRGRVIVATDSSTTCRRAADRRDGTWVISRDGKRGRRLGTGYGALHWDGQALIGSSVRRGVDRLRLRTGNIPGCRT